MKNPAILPSIQPTKKEESYVFFSIAEFDRHSDKYGQSK